MKKVFEWVLLESSAPADIRRLALAYMSETGKLPDCDIGGTCVPPSHYDEITSFMRNGQKIQAIKSMRAISGLGLKEAKDAVERWQANQPAQKPSEPAAVKSHTGFDVTPGSALERQVEDLQAECDHWRKSTLYLADCHAANLSIAELSRTSKSEWSRLADIMEYCRDLITKVRSVPHLFSSNRRQATAVVERLEEGINIIRNNV